MNSKEQIQPVLNDAAKAAGNQYTLGFETTINADMSAKDANKLQKTLSDYLAEGDKPIQRMNEEKDQTISGTSPRLQSYDDTHQQFLSFAGGFLFIGLVLGFTFILGTALIIYYKQISEGEQDKRSFEILQEVGLSSEEVRQTIRSQVLLVFFMPIAVAVVHFSFAFIMIQKLISLFGTTRFSLLLLTSIGTISAVAIIYYIIYKQTSRAYYRIVER
ncbi:FtsX-like permease family protein [Sporolactobacillus laevolacticus]|uniref:FtsX-like permease family protein n=1 Tax=Sporolactobacillus laevolacticus TaxID=33018 RepID=UPI0003FE8297|nr:FtsX-like permease family protein [Sporolactobacillus laevolacticus]